MVGGFFPTPYPDECYYSVLCRYHVRSGSVSYSRTTKALFGNMQCLSSTIFFPTRLECLDNWLPHDSPVSRRNFVMNHTIYPYMVMMYSSDFRVEMENVMNGVVPAFELNRIGETKSLPLWPKYLKYCPECVKEDISKYGEPYWHRTHQLFGTAYCTKHLVRLLHSNIPTKRTTTDFCPASDEVLFETPPDSHDELVQYKKEFMKISKESEWLLEHGLTIDWDANGFEKYKQLLRDRKLSTIQGISNYEEIDKAFTSYWGKGFLNALRLETGDNRNWIYQIQGARIRTFKSLYHVMLMCFLSDSVEQFVGGNAAVNPFGVGPWQCKNPICGQYNLSGCQNTEIKYQNGIATGFFKCEFCGMLYKQTKHRRNDGEPIVVEYGQLWVDELKRCLGKEKMTEQQTADVLKCEVHIVHFHRKKLGLSKMREYIRQPLRYDAETGGEAFYKAQVLDLFEKHQEVTFTLLRELAPGAYSYLSKHHKDWLHERLTHEHKRTHMQDADKILLEQVRSAVNWIKTHGDENRRLTIGYIADVAEVAYHELVYSKAKRPLTKAYIESVVESKENWLRRRIIAIWKSKEENELITINDIRNHMYIKQNAYIKYGSYIEDLMSELNSNRIK